jgi:hypothetical protein
MLNKLANPAGFYMLPVSPKKGAIRNEEEYAVYSFSVSAGLGFASRISVHRGGGQVRQRLD